MDLLTIRELIDMHIEMQDYENTGWRKNAMQYNLNNFSIKSSY